MKLSLRWLAMTVFGALATVAACSTSDKGFDSRTAPLIDPDANAPEAAPAEACAGKRCSRDLHSVLDGCTDQTISTCADTQGCADGACVSACDSAAKSQGSIGCSFWTVPPDVQQAGQNSCYAAFVANTWNTPVHVTAEYGADSLDVSKSIYRAATNPDGTVSYSPLGNTIAPGEVGIVFLSQGDSVPGDEWIACPAGVNVAFYGTPIANHTSSIYKAFHVITDAPVSAYSIFPYGGALSYIPTATLLIPSSSWSTSYFLVDGWPGQNNVAYPFVQIVAQEDNTEIRMKPSVAIKDGTGVAGSPKDFLTSWTINRGQVLELAQLDSLSGTPISTNHPVAVFGGSQCVDIPSNNVAACDSLQQQIAPVSQWASRYSAVPYESRRTAVSPPLPEAVIWKIVGARDGTTLTYDPAAPRDAPTTLKAGEVATFTSEVPFVVKSQSNDYPIYVAVYMSGATNYGTQGDPDFVSVVPDDQFLDHYVFFVDHTYADSNLTIVRHKDVSGFHDVNLDCLGAVSGWQPLGADGTVEYAWVDLTKKKADVGKCSYGRHEASSDGPFMLYVWGLDFCASYGFPAGAGSRPTSPYSVDVH